MAIEYHIDHSLTLTMIIETHVTGPHRQSDQWHWCDSDRQSTRTEQGEMAIDYHIDHSLTITMIIDTHDIEPRIQSDR